MPKQKDNKLLSEQEMVVCKEIATLEVPFNQRAKALLSLNEGRTQFESAELSGLSVGQVKYLIARYRELGLDIFPSILMEHTILVSVEQKDETTPAIKSKKKKSGKSEKKKKIGKAKKEISKKEKLKKGKKRKDSDKKKKARRKADKQSKKDRKSKKVKKGKKK